MKLRVIYVNIYTIEEQFFQGVSFINCFWIFKWVAGESLLHRVHGVQIQVGIGVRINNLQTQVVETTLT